MTRNTSHGTSILPRQPVRSGCCFVGRLDSKRGQGPRRDFTVRLDVRGLAFFGFAAFGVQPACGTSGGNGFVAEAGTHQAGAGGSFGGDAGGTSPLEAHVERDHRPVTVVTLGCAGCVDVDAVATGGSPPYAFTWEDGSTGPTRHLCPSSTTEYSVTVTDTATAGELGTPAATAHADLTADVTACPDASTASDASTVLDGTDQDPGLPDASTDDASTCFLLGSDVYNPGPSCSVFGRVFVFTLSGLPFPLRAGQGYSIGAHILSSGSSLGSSVWSLGPSTDGCTVSAPLAQWTSTGADVVQTVCVKPQQDLTQLFVAQSITGSAGAEFTYCGPCP